MHRDLGLCQREIARALEIGQSTLHDYLRRWEASGLVLPLEAGLSDAELDDLLPKFIPAIVSNLALLSLA
jgi:hypothetical protein